MENLQKNHHFHRGGIKRTSIANEICGHDGIDLNDHAMYDIHRLQVHRQPRIVSAPYVY